MGVKVEKIKTASPEETKRLGHAIGASAKAGWIICLDGPMGAGKTAMSQGILQGLGVTGYITSPTYSIVHTYETDLGKVHHFDIYRLSSMEELWDIGFEEYLKDAVVVIEWASLVRDELTGAILDIGIELGEEPYERCIALKGEESLLSSLNLDKGWERT